MPKNAIKLMKNHTGPNYQKKISMMEKSLVLLQTIALVLTPSSKVVKHDNLERKEDNNLIFIRNRSLVVTQACLDSVSSLVDEDDFDAFNEKVSKTQSANEETLDCLLADNGANEQTKNVEFNEFFDHLSQSEWVPEKIAEKEEKCKVLVSCDAPSFDVPQAKEVAVVETRNFDMMSSSKPVVTESSSEPVLKETSSKPVVTESSSEPVLKESLSKQDLKESCSEPPLKKKKRVKKCEDDRTGEMTSNGGKEQESDEKQEEENCPSNMHRKRNLDGKMRKIRNKNRKNPQRVIERVDSLISLINMWFESVSKSQEILKKEVNREKTNLFWGDTMNLMFNRHMSAMRTLVDNKVFLDIYIPEIAVFQEQLETFSNEMTYKPKKEED